MKELRKDTVILKPDKGNGVVVTDTTDYYESFENHFQIQQNSRGLMQILPIPGCILYNQYFI